MNRSDVIYRALAEYNKQTAAEREYAPDIKAVLAADGADCVTVVRTLCTVEQDWINAVEEGLTHIEKAINEARQFIRVNGEIVPVEKVKRVSKDSVEHLAKHSSLISVPPADGEDLIPEKLFVVERLSDFTVYENKFLYLLLCRLRDFISVRYNDILDLTNTYRGSAAVTKTVAMNKRKVVFKLTLSEEGKDDAVLKRQNPCRPDIERIELLLKAVAYFLATPLMQEVSKVPMLKPPITKTNVLKMNRNFKGAVALYDFITAYDLPGYSVETREEKLSPLPESAAREFADTVMRTSFLTYKHGLGLEKYFKKAYDEEEARRKAAEEERKKELLLRLKGRIAESGYSPAEYILMLESRQRALEADAEKLILAEKDINRLNAEADTLKEEIKLLNASAAESRTAYEQLEQRYSEDMLGLRAAHERETAALTERYIAEHEKAVAALNERHNALAAEREGVIARLNGALLEENARHKKESAERQAAHAENVSALKRESGAEIERLTAAAARRDAEYESLLAGKALSDSLLNALKKEHNLMEGEDFTDKERFDDLERQFKVFKAFFKEEWRKTKKAIRKEVKNEK